MAGRLSLCDYEIETRYSLDFLVISDAVQRGLEAMARGDNNYEETMKKEDAECRTPFERLLK